MAAPDWRKMSSGVRRLLSVSNEPSSECLRNGICKNCHSYEDLGRKSERDWYNKDFAKYFDRVEMTKDDGELEIFDPPFIDIRFSNV